MRGLIAFGLAESIAFIGEVRAGAAAEVYVTGWIAADDANRTARSGN